VPFSVVVLRTVGGRGVTSGDWSYEYSSPGYMTNSSTDPATGEATDLHVTTILRPDGLRDTYTMYGFGWAADQNAFGYTYAVGLTREIARADRAEVEVFDWDGRFDAPVSPETIYSAPIYSTSCGAHFIADGAVYAPMVKGHWLIRDGATYVTESSDFDAYGQPATVVETGYQGAIGNAPPPPAVRTTGWTYFAAPVDGSGATLNMVRGKPLTEHVCIEAGCFDSSWTYGGPGYAKDSETQSGVTTQFDYYPDGNLWKVTNALNQSLRLVAYAYGVPTNIDFNGAFNITRTASWEGRTLSETDGRGFGYTTGYEYDAIGRVLRTTPPGDNLATDYTYADDGSWVNLTRGTYSKTTNVDGLGREVSSSDSENVLTSAKYDAMGRAWFKSYPYDAAGGEVGEKLEFDGLGRVVTETKAFRPMTSACDEPGACQVTSVYYGNCLETVVERGQQDSTATWRCNTSYGDPGEQRLTQVSDAAGSLWEYAYNAAGKLSNVSAPLSQGDRSYFYDSRQFLTSESSGERGTIGYGRNAIGQMLSKSDARPVTVSYHYTDPLSRLRTVTYPNDATDSVSMDYDKANNVLWLSQM
jgi:YD repeat-containing protein